MPMVHHKHGKYPDNHREAALAGKLWGGVFMPANDKTRKIKLGKTTADRDIQKMLLHLDDPQSHFNPHKLLRFYADHCHPGAQKFYA